MESRIWREKKTTTGGSEGIGVSTVDNVRAITRAARNWRVTMLMIVAAGLLLSLGMFQLGQMVNRRDTERSTNTVNRDKSFSMATPDTHEHVPRYGVNGTESNFATGCGNVGEHKTFPNLGYSLLGYNILRGYPLSVGHDPGFTLPIFAADYSAGLSTADCRHKLPYGLMVISDVSCEISFSSKVSKTQFQMVKALSASANVGGGGWGVEFSASAEYKTSSSEMRTGEYVFIFSTASCGYYYNELFTRQPPTLHPMFSDWVKRLASGNKEVYFEFFDTYGTHFAKKVAYGAKYSYQYKMQMEAYEKSLESGVDVAVQASYSGLYSVSGGAGMTSDQKRAASSFSKSVESKLITTGAVPAAKGGARAWAAEVKENPLPISYDLDSIEHIFTPKFLPRHDKQSIMNISSRIVEYKMDYCQWLKMKDQVNSCAALQPGIELDNVAIGLVSGKDTSELRKSYSECIDSCLDDIRCLAINYCITCRDNSDLHQICLKLGRYHPGQTLFAKEMESMDTVIFYEKLNYTLTLLLTIIKGSPRTLDKSNRQVSQSKCHTLCLRDAGCTAFTHQSGNNNTSTCLLYGADYIQSLATGSGAVTKFMPWGRKARDRALRDLDHLHHNRTAMAFQQLG